MKILALGTSHTFGNCSPEGHISPENRWTKLLAKDCNADITTLSMSGTSFQQQAHTVFRYLEGTKNTFDIAIIEGRNMGMYDSSYPKPTTKGDVNLWDYDSPNHELFYKSWLTNDISMQTDRLLPFQSLQEFSDTEFYKDYVFSPLHFIECYFVNLGMCKYLEQYCNKVGWFSMNYPKTSNEHYKSWAWEIMQEYALGKLQDGTFEIFVNRSPEDRCGCGHPNEKGHRKIADALRSKLKEIQWI